MGYVYGLSISILEGDEIPFTFLYHVTTTCACWACSCIKKLLVCQRCLHNVSHYLLHGVLNPKINIKKIISIIHDTLNLKVKSNWVWKYTNLLNINNLWFMILCKKANFTMLHHLLGCIVLVALIPSALKCLYICDPIPSNHNCYVFFTFHFGLHIGGDGPHTPCSHA